MRPRRAIHLVVNDTRKQAKTPARDLLSSKRDFDVLAEKTEILSDENGIHDPQPAPEPPVPALSAPDPAVFIAPTPKPRAPRLRLGHSNRERLNLYILRHASAGTRRANPKLDIKRPLDKEGKQHCFQLAHVLNGLNLSFDAVISSPLKRCLQTAQLVGTEMGYDAKVLHAEALQPEADFGQFQRLVNECRNYESVLMVGHNPNLTHFLGHLIGEISTDAHGVLPARVRLRKGSIARVTVERGPGMLQWLLEPRIVRALYATSTKSSRRRTSRK